MNKRTLSLSLLLSSAATVAACSSPPQPSASASWDCYATGVPNGSAVQCVSTNASAVTGSYTCGSGDVSSQCPTSGAASNVDTSGGGYTYGTGDDTSDTDAGTSDQGSGGQGSSDQGSGSGYTTGSGGGDTTGSGSGYTTGSGSGYTTGNGNGNGNGNGGGNPHTGGSTGNPHTGGSSSSDCDAGAGSSGGSSGGSSSGGSSSGGSTGGGYTCVGSDGSTTCTTPPTCQPGSHASPCGACVPDDSNEDCSPPTQGGCWVTGGGFIVDADGNDSFGGNAMPMKSGTIRGEWEHVDHGTGNKSHGQAQYLVCRHVNEPGPGQPSGPNHHFDINQVYFGGPARWFTNGTWADGYWFDVMAEDHGEGKSPNAKNFGGPDYYHFTIRKMVGANQSGAIVYDTENDMSGGNIQIHPPNNGHPYTSSSLPSWVSLQQ